MTTALVECHSTVSRPAVIVIVVFEPMFLSVAVSSWEGERQDRALWKTWLHHTTHCKLRSLLISHCVQAVDGELHLHSVRQHVRCSLNLQTNF